MNTSFIIYRIIWDTELVKVGLKIQKYRIKFLKLKIINANQTITPRYAKQSFGIPGIVDILTDMT